VGAAPYAVQPVSIPLQVRNLSREIEAKAGPMRERLQAVEWLENIFPFI